MCVWAAAAQDSITPDAIQSEHLFFMKTAIIIAGMCRHSSLPSTTWSIFPFETDWYMSTWDITKSTYGSKMYYSSYEINKIRDKFKHIEIFNHEEYRKKFIDTFIHPVYAKPYYLVSKIRDIVLKEKYDRFIITRSDLYLHKIKDLTEDDFYVDELNAKILGLHDPIDFIRYEQEYADDTFLCMNRSAFEKFSNLDYFLNLAKSFGDMHRYTYAFFKRNGIKLEPIYNMRSILIRPESENYVESHENFTYEDLVNVFVNAYMTSDVRWGGKGKFFDDYDAKIVDFNEMLARVHKSRENGGILKLRKQ